MGFEELEQGSPNPSPPQAHRMDWEESQAGYFRIFHEFRSFIPIQSYTTFCLIEVRAMIVAVQPPSAECTAIFTMSIVLSNSVHLPVQWQ